MKYSKKDLMNEGWASMETLLNEEMPTETKSNNYMMVALFVMCAFGLGLLTGTQINTKDTAEVINKETSPSIISEPISAFIQSEDSPIQATVSEKARVSNIVARNEKSYYRVADTKKTQTKDVTYTNTTLEEGHSYISELNQAPNQKSLVSHKASLKQPTASEKLAERSFLNLSFLSLAPLKKIFAKGITTSTLPKVTDKLKNKSNWVLGLGMNTGLNLDRNTTVLSLNSDWMYRLGKQNSIGVQLLYASEDEFSNGQDVETPKRPDPKGGSGRSPETVPTINSKQHRIATGLVIQQEIGYRFYSNFAFGVDMLQNYYTHDAQLKSLSNVQEVRYSLGGYSSLSLGYRLSNLIDLEVSGTKSIFLRDVDYIPGNSNHIVGGVKISF